MNYYYVYQSGFQGTWCRSELEVVRWLCDNFGLKFEDIYENVFRKLESMGTALHNEPLSLHILKY